MRRGQKSSAEQVALKLRQIEVQTARGKSLALACKETEISEQSYDRWRKEYAGLHVDQARRMKDLERENARLRRLVADLSVRSSPDYRSSWNGTACAVSIRPCLPKLRPTRGSPARAPPAGRVLRRRRKPILRHHAPALSRGTLWSRAMALPVLCPSCLIAHPLGGTARPCRHCPPRAPLRSRHERSRHDDGGYEHFGHGAVRLGA